MSTNVFVCRRCGYSSAYKHALIKHFEKKKLCKAKLEDIDVNELLHELRPVVKEKFHQCSRCNKQFAHPSGLSRHKKYCSHDNELDREFHKGVFFKLKSEMRDELKEELKKEIIAELQSQSKYEHQTHVTGDNNTIYQNSYIVVLNNFGSEDVSHVIDDKLFLDDCLKMLQTGIPKIVNKIYYDENKPENKTVVLKSIKRKTALVHSNGKWQEHDLNQVIPIMVRKGSRILTNHLLDKEIPPDDTDIQEVIDAKHRFIGNVSMHKKPEYDIVSSAVKASVFNHRHVCISSFA